VHRCTLLCARTPDPQWENPLQTGILFTGVNVFFVLIYLLKYTMMMLVAFLVLVAIASR
jgi:hypothetical protein